MDDLQILLEQAVPEPRTASTSDGGAHLAAALHCPPPLPHHCHLPATVCAWLVNAILDRWWRIAAADLNTCRTGAAQAAKAGSRVSGILLFLSGRRRLQSYL